MVKDTWSKAREKEIATAQKLMSDPNSYNILYGVEKDGKLVKKGLKSSIKAGSIRSDLKTANTKQRNADRLQAESIFKAGKITKAALRKILDKNSIIPKYDVVYTEKKMKPTIKKKVDKILSGK